MLQINEFVETIQVASRRKQQEILDLCHDVPQVTALGTSRRHEHFVTIECSDLFWQSAAELLIAELDPSARLLKVASELSASSAIGQVASAILQRQRAL